ncbi:MAG: hypothetical protein SPL15_06635 [Lachnospiraceae bacterium]|nr:hypothetical protein [Lachnospiraceae bacterium]MDY5742652.1 hypothetical protein [Lachnospiraceae bacterium]
MIIKGMAQLIEKLRQSIHFYPDIEYGFWVAIKEEYRGYSIIGIYALDNKDTFFHIYSSRVESFQMLTFCQRNGYVPLLVHTHPYYGNEIITFSRPDYQFMESFVTFGLEKFGITKYLFFVTNGEKYQIVEYVEDKPFSEKGELKSDSNERFFCSRKK